MANKTTHEDDPIDLLGDDAIPPSRGTQATLTETSNMNQRLAVMTTDTNSKSMTASEDTNALIYQRVGRKVVHDMYAKIGNVTNLLDLQKIKESKQYKGFTGLVDGKQVIITTWNDYCKLIEGRSRESIDLDLQNLEKLGPELFEAMGRVGLGPATMRTIRQLPEDDRAVIEQAAQANSKDEIVDLIDGLVTKHTREKSSLHEEIKELGETIGNHRKQYDKLSTEHDNVSREYNRLTRTKKPGESTYNARTFEVRHESAALEYGSRIHVDALEVMLDAVLGEDSPSQERELQLHALGLAAGALYARAESFYLRIKNELGEVMPIQPSSKYMLQDDERSRLETSVSMIDVNFHRKKGAREYERNEDAPVGRGRPKGSKNKDKEAE